MRRLCGLALLVLVLASTTCVWSQGRGEPVADDWTGTAEQKILGLATIWAEAKYAFPSFEQLPGLD
jgi:hypothetical protein